MIDTSDGLSTDLQHICQESRVGAVVYAQSLPRLPGARGLEFAVHGGEDYDLLFSARPGRNIPHQIAGVPVTCIGEIVRGTSILLATPDGNTRALMVQGWEHFR